MKKKSPKNPNGWTPGDERIEQKVECVYCDIFLRKEVTKYEGPKETPFRTVPMGYGGGLALE